MSKNLDDNHEEIFSRVLRAGRRTYFFDVRETKASDYYLTVTDSEGCLDTETYEVAENDAIIITYNSNPATCGENNGSADIIIDGGVVGAGYQIVWKDNSNSTIATNTTNIDNKRSEERL